VGEANHRAITSPVGPLIRLCAAASVNGFSDVERLRESASVGPHFDSYVHEASGFHRSSKTVKRPCATEGFDSSPGLQNSMRFTKPLKMPFLHPTAVRLMVTDAL
jgi:hypothetical protein